jgi:hypothetical protein
MTVVICAVPYDIGEAEQMQNLIFGFLFGESEFF